MQLKSETVDWIFGRMAVRYGAAWLNKWDGIPMEAVKTDWARELGMTRSDAIAYALRFLPLDFPPTVLRFREICRRAPEPEQPKRLQGPPVDIQRVAELTAKAKAATSGKNSRRWAEALRDREKTGDVLTEGQRYAWRNALRDAPAEQITAAGKYTPIDPSCLPPGMRGGAA